MEVCTLLPVFWWNKRYMYSSMQKRSCPWTIRETFPCRGKAGCTWNPLKSDFCTIGLYWLFLRLTWWLRLLPFLGNWFRNLSPFLILCVLAWLLTQQQKSLGLEFGKQVFFHKQLWTACPYPKRAYLSSERVVLFSGQFLPWKKLRPFDNFLISFWSWI